MISIIGAILGVLFFLIFKDSLIEGENNAAKYYIYFTSGWILLFVSRLLFLNLDMYLRMNLKTVLGVFLENFLTKVIFLFGLIAYVIGVINFDGIFWINILAVSFPGIVIILYLISKKESFFTFKFIKRYTVRSKEIGNLALYGIIGGIGSTFVTDIDKFMISNEINLSATGIYSVMMLFGMFISLPSINLKRVSTPIIAESWKNNDIDNINTIYKKSALNQLLFGFYIFLGIWFCIDYVMDILNFSYVYRIAKDVILFIGIAQMIEMSTGVNSEIIATSKSYRWNTFFLFLLVIVVYSSNAILIPIFSIEGAAMATAVSFLIVNLLRYTFLKVKYKLTPFSNEFFLGLFIGLGVFTLLYYMPELDNNYIGIILNGGLITILFWTASYLLKLSPEINKIIDKVILRKKQ
jgi:O-antigen/teichoic acid export membrane protein